MTSDHGWTVRADGAEPATAGYFVSVEQRDARSPCPPAAPSTDGAPAAGPALALDVRTASAHTVLRASPGSAQPGEPAVLDEHFVVNADTRTAPRWRECADVLYGSRARSSGEATRWLLAVASPHRTCRIAAVPLVRGGWAVLDTGRQEVVALPLPGTASGRPWLLPSCLLGWLTAGGTLPELLTARVECFPVPCGGS